MTNLLAVCRPNNEFIIKRVRVTQEVQERIGPIFDFLETLFYSDVEEESEFDGSWKPDDTEALYITGNVQAASILAAAQGNILELDEIDTGNFGEEDIKGLLVAKGLAEGQNPKVLLQVFSAQQILNRKFTLLQEGNSFKQLTENAFSIGNNLCAIIEGDRVKFKSFHNIRRILDLAEFYIAATDQQLTEFCGHEKLSVGDVGAFLAAADQITRKLVYTVSNAGTLNTHDVETIVNKAAALGLNLNVVDGRIIMPNDRKDIKVLLRFLDDGIYEAALSQMRYQTNSKRQLV